MRRNLILIFIVFFADILSAQQRQVIFDKIDLEKVLTNGVVLNIMQDSYGFIWIATFEGLVRFDGYDFKQISSGGNSPYAISSDRTYHLHEGKDKKMWIGTWEGLNCMDLKTGKIERYIEINPKTNQKIAKLANYVFEDSQGRVWVGLPNGLHQFDKSSKQFFPSRQNNRIGWNYRSSGVTGICEAKDGMIWSGGNAGLLKIDPQTNTYQRIFLRKDTTKIDSQVVRKIYFSRDNTLWVGMMNGFWKSSDNGNTFEQVKLPNNDLMHAHVQSIVEDAEGFLWLGFAQKGLLRWHPHNGTSQYFQYSSINTNSLVSSNITVLTRDKNNTIWIGTSNGVNKINTQNHRFEFYQNDPEVRPDNINNAMARIYYDHKNGFWAGNVSNTYRARQIGEPLVKVTDLKDTVFFEMYHQGTDGRLWLGGMRIFGISNYGGLFYYDASKNRVFRAKGDKRTTYARIFDLKTDKQNPNWLWLGTSIGLCHYNIITADTAWYYPNRQYPDMTNAIQRFYETDDKQIWFASAGNGLGHFEIETQKFEFLKPNPNNPNSIVSDFVRAFCAGGKDTIWIATTTGLSCFDAKRRIFTNFTLFNGLRGGNLIYDVVADKIGNIWFTTNQYLCAYNTTKRQFSYYWRAHGFATNFNRSSMFVDEGGKVYVGGTNGIIAFNPATLQTYQKTPQVVLTDFSIKNKSQHLEQTFENTEKIFLDYSDNVFSFQFSALEFIDNEHIKYAYKMEGFDKEWQYTDTERRATFTNLPSGTYTFLAKATNFEGVWSNEPTLKITVIIASPFWLQKWFIVLITWLLIALGYFIYRFLQKQTELKKQKELAEQSALYKSQFLANMSHEIRTPMNSIIGLSQLLSEMTLENKPKEYVETIKQSAENLLVIINDILDYSKIASGKFTFVKQPFHLDIIVGQVKRILNIRIEEKGLSFYISIEKNVPLHLIGDQARLSQILLNLIGNAVKFTEKGSIELKISVKWEKNEEVILLFEVKDTGIGIAEERLNTIFESFEQGDEKVYNTFGGTGLGLSITKQLIEQQNGVIAVKSELGKGSIFSFSLPYGIALADNIAINSAELNEISLKDLSILIVDDTLFNLMLAEELLKKNIENVRVETANNGQIAIEKIQEREFDLILMDVKMPIMDGYEATKIIRNLSNAKSEIPIIALTANAIPEQVQLCLDAGMNDCITKPINSEQLFAAIRAVLVN